MARMRQIVMWVTQGAIALLVLLSIVGAFIGVESARSLFNSLPLAAYWIILVGLLVMGLLLFKRLRRSPGLLIAHLGPALILAGAVYSSDTGHILADRYLGIPKIPSGQMVIYEGNMDNVVRDRRGHEIGKLSFNVGLKDFWIEYYEERAPWLLGVDAPPAAPGGKRRQKEITWAVGQKMQLPFVGLGMKVLQYLPGARPALLEVVQAVGKSTIVPAEVGQEVPLKNPEGTLRVVQVFSHLIVQAGGKVVDLPGSNANPALRIEFGRAGEEKTYLYVYAGPFRMSGQEIAGVDLHYVPMADPNSVLPAMEVLLSGGDKELRAWLTARKPDQPIILPLTPLLDVNRQEQDHSSHEGHEEHANGNNAYLVMARGSGPIKDYKSSLVVVDEGQQVAEKVIEVNDPLHHGGYHFYQQSYDSIDGQYTVLGVESDAGLWPVYAGFFLLCVGIFWLFWLRPAWVYLMKRGDHGS